MGEYLSPGVYVEETSSGAKPIEGVGTSTGAFVGVAEKGPIDEAVLVTNWTQFVENFGSFSSDSYLAYSVFQFFNEGGTKCFVVRAASSDAAAASVTLQDSTPANTLLVEALGKGTYGNNLSVSVENGTDADTFKLTVMNGEDIVESHDNLVMSETDVDDNPNINFIEKRINGKSKWISVDIDGEGFTKERPKNVAATSLSGGNNGSTLAQSDAIGTESDKRGIHAFDVVDEINIVSIPDMAGDRGTILAALSYCENRKDCFFVADPPLGLETMNVKAFKEGTGDYTGNAFNSSYGALYYPWIKVYDPLTNEGKFTPPSGAIVGTYSHSDVARGVHKAPAGTVEGYLNSVTGVKKIVTKGEHDVLNPVNVNVIRSFPGTGICVWGARTVSADAEWKYVNVRRLFMFLEESILKASQWVVFEPNDPALWGSVKRNITAFLTRVWRDGALFGKTAEEAFFVKIDEENNPPEVRDAGQLIIEIGAAPVKPAEFVIIRISQKTLTK